MSKDNEAAEIKLIGDVEAEARRKKIDEFTSDKNLMPEVCRTCPVLAAFREYDATRAALKEDLQERKRETKSVEGRKAYAYALMLLRNPNEVLK